MKGHFPFPLPQFLASERTRSTRAIVFIKKQLFRPFQLTLEQEHPVFRGIKMEGLEVTNGDSAEDPAKKVVVS